MAVKLISASVQKRYGPGCRVLGEMYETGEGVKKDLGLAIDMYKCAVEFGCEEALKELKRFIPDYESTEDDSDKGQLDD